MPKQITFSDWLKRAKEKHGDLYDYSKSEETFCGSCKNVRITCKKHGPFDQLAKYHANGSHCPKCAKRGTPAEDLTGKTFGKLTAIRLSSKRVKKKTFWWLRCECGNEVEIQTSNLKIRKDPTCGNCNTHDAEGNPLSIDLTHHIKSFKPRGQDITNQRFGKLVAKVYYVKEFEKSHTEGVIGIASAIAEIPQKCRP